MLKHINDIQSHSIDGVSKIWFTPTDKYYVRSSYSDMQPELSKRLPLRIKFSHEEHCYKNYYRRRESSEVFSIELVLEGSMLFVQDNKQYHVTAGNVFLIHHDHDNEFTTGPEGHCHRLACCLSGNELNGLLHTTKLIEHDVIKLNNQDTVEKTIRECYQKLKEKAPGFRRKLSMLAYRLLLELEENIEQINTPDILFKAINLMDHHLSQDLNLKKLSETLNSTPATLNRIFQEHFKTSPINYLINLRIKAAKSLLINTKLQIQEVAHSIGYANPLYFSSEFKKRTGLSPREFRKQVV